MNTRQKLCTAVVCIGFAIPATAFAQTPAGDHAVEHEAHTNQPAPQSREARPGSPALTAPSSMQNMDEHMRRMAQLRAEIASAPTPEKREAAMRAQMHAMEQGMAAMKNMKGMGGMQGMHGMEGRRSMEGAPNRESADGMQSRQGMGEMHGQGGMPMMAMHQMMEKRMSMMEEMMQSMMQMMQTRMQGAADGRMRGMGGN